MGKRQKEWARRKRDELTEILGGCCKRCEETEKLEFDCIIPTGEEHHKFEMSQRMSFYWREYHSNKNLQLLCDKCHGKKSRGERRHPWMKFFCKELVREISVPF